MCCAEEIGHGVHHEAKRRCPETQLASHREPCSVAAGAISGDRHVLSSRSHCEHLISEETSCNDWGLIDEDSPGSRCSFRTSYLAGNRSRRCVVFRTSSNCGPGVERDGSLRRSILQTSGVPFGSLASLAICSFLFALHSWAALADNVGSYELGRVVTSSGGPPQPGPRVDSTLPNLFESASICQHYKELSPPMMHRRSMSMGGGDGLRLRPNTEARKLRQSSKSLAESAVLILDLDKTSIYGNDGNDLGIALQWMEKPDTVVKDLYKLLVSPCVKPAYEEMRAQAKQVHVVLYTRRPQVLKYQSCFRECTIPVQYKKEWHHEGQLYLPSHIVAAEEVLRTYCGPELLEDELNDVKKSMERLIAARDAISNHLGLDAKPTVVVTATDKSIEDTVKRLKLPDTNAYLFDDNKGLQYDPHAIVVEPLEALPQPRRCALLRFMEQHMPTEELEEELVEYLEGARDCEKAIEWNSELKQWRWRVPLASRPVQPWAVPELKRSCTPWERATESGFESPPWETGRPSAANAPLAGNGKVILAVPSKAQTSKSNGCLSPVTPAEDVHSEKEDLRGGVMMVDLKAVAERALQLREEQAMRV
eukprot:CAMPEP_0181295660 /NCGR_PEP_ID=MMETSP1101-20121128/4269_1 /TAXON_ID=46948 /ORGANISM="Rhodomonas abbreviata, Strain Caron Lab Isolate" /LENGTH=592 /DNA_ID=CAMNT_0023400433 /DNA_START=249 /DNA_END=2027 /DNA_ORIENTATION=+